MEFAASNGMSEIMEPYTIQTITPISSMISIGREISAVCFVFKALIDCGRNANVVRLAAINPVIRTGSKLKINFNINFISNQLI